MREYEKLLVLDFRLLYLDSRLLKITPRYCAAHAVVRLVLEGASDAPSNRVGIEDRWVDFRDLGIGAGTRQIAVVRTSWL